MGRLRRMAHLFNIGLSSLFYTSTICVSNAIREALVRDYRFPAKKTIVIRNGVSLREFDQRRGNETNVRTKLGLSSKEFVLVCAARLDEQKGINVLLEALAKLLNDGVRFKCIIVGDGPLRKQLSEQALALNLCDHVFFEGFQPDVRPYLHAADLFVLTSNREGLPLSVLEAMACGLPCVVTDVGGNAEAVIHGKTGLVASAGSVDQIAAAVAYSARNPQERARMSEMARTRACESFDVVKQMDKIREVLLR